MTPTIINGGLAHHRPAALNLAPTGIERHPRTKLEVTDGPTRPTALRLRLSS